MKQVNGNQAAPVSNKRRRSDDKHIPQVCAFPGCCQAIIHTGFSGYSGKPIYVGPRGYRVEFATTRSTDQKDGERALREAGFHIFASTKGNYGDYRMNFWVRGDDTLKMGEPQEEKPATLPAASTFRPVRRVRYGR